MISRLPLPSDPGLVVVSAADLDAFTEAAFEACNVLAQLAAGAAEEPLAVGTWWAWDPAASRQCQVIWERLSKWCSE